MKLPNRALKECLLPSLEPCKFFSSICNEMRWEPANGHVPRGYIGGEGTLEEIQLVLIVAEPGDPLPGESFDGTKSTSDLFDEVYTYVRMRYETCATQFHTNARLILDLCWPGLDFDSQLKKVWITESVLCSAKVESGNVPVQICRTCTNSFLEPQLQRIPNAVLAALGSKARNRTQHISNIVPAFAIAPPGCNRKEARESWEKIAKLVRGGQDENPKDQACESIEQKTSQAQIKDTGSRRIAVNGIDADLVARIDDIQIRDFFKEVAHDLSPCKISRNENKNFIVVKSGRYTVLHIHPFSRHLLVFIPKANGRPTDAIRIGKEELGFDVRVLSEGVSYKINATHLPSNKSFLQELVARRS